VYGSKDLDPDPYKNVTDPEHCFVGLIRRGHSKFFMNDSNKMGPHKVLIKKIIGKTERDSQISSDFHDSHRAATYLALRIVSLREAPVLASMSAM
jgi:hypothetical protein